MAAYQHQEKPGFIRTRSRVPLGDINYLKLGQIAHRPLFDPTFKVEGGFGNLKFNQLPILFKHARWNLAPEAFTQTVWTYYRRNPFAIILHFYIGTACVGYWYHKQKMDFEREFRETNGHGHH